MGKGQPSPEILDRLPPQNLEAERAVLGSILLDPKLMEEAAGILEPKHFYADIHQRIFRCFLKLHNTGAAVDVLAVRDSLKRRGEHADIGGSAYLAEIAQSVPYAANFRYYSRIVQRTYAQRSMIQFALAIVQRAYGDQYEPWAICAWALRGFGKMQALLEKAGLAKKDAN